MKARIMFDTLTYANRLKAAGLESKIAETQAEANADMIANLLDNSLLSKQDFQHELSQLELRFELKLQETETRLEAKIADLDSKVQETRSDLTQLITQTETRLTLRLGGIMAGSMGIATAVLSVLHFIH